MRFFPALPGRAIGLLVLALWLAAGTARAHNGEDHGAAPAAAMAGATYFTTTAASEQFELVLRYEPLHGGQPARLRLFIADFATNAPIHGARLKITAVENPAVGLSATEQAPGDYQLTGQFPEDRTYGLAVQVVAPDGRADLLLVPGVAVGKALPSATAPAAIAPWLTWKTGLLLGGGFLAGVALTALLMRRRSAQPH